MSPQLLRSGQLPERGLAFPRTARQAGPRPPLRLELLGKDSASAEIESLAAAQTSGLLLEVVEQPAAAVKAAKSFGLVALAAAEVVP